MLQMDQPLFARAFMSGGSSLLMPPALPDSQEGIYREVIKAVGLESASVEERVNTLTTMPILELMSKLAMPLPYRPTIDGEIVKYAATYAVVGDRNSSEIASREWLKGLMIGDCQFDVSRHLHSTSSLGKTTESKLPTLRSTVRRPAFSS